MEGLLSAPARALGERSPVHEDVAGLSQVGRLGSEDLAAPGGQILSLRAMAAARAESQGPPRQPQLGVMTPDAG